MASIQTVGLVVVAMFLLTPGLIISIPTGPNKIWIMGGQVTWLNSAIHACLVGAIVFYFAQ